MLKNLILQNRSCRRFLEAEPISRQTLVDLVDLARLSATAGNLQPLKFILSCDPETNGLIFPYLRWAGYLRDWTGPGAGERPSAYILVLGDTAVTRVFGIDHGIAAQSMMLGAVELELAGCMIGSIDREGLRAKLSISDRYEIHLVLALGKPAETVVLETASGDGSIKYWRDVQGVHHVPKRNLDDVILG